ncbi:sigma-70 family RNA polymerase sigma factor [Terracoccus sp. 273MFTsu3.1]|uniref:sigma-70 family RNA polymerase sigma factor n=1 Tax=Terracoccus sp. 273MFTsu3.1 TaxID=1172188 RepID=UPI00035E0913|nr:sigma-70 family RNA polymerase sigma factor [Terracoccus sp. 273MFTsu3.1]
MGRQPVWESDYCAYYAARQRAFMRTAYAILGSWAAAEDAAQSTFTQLYVHWPRIHDETRDAYARRALVNSCYTAARKARREPLVAEVPDRAADVRERVDPELMAALAQLSAKHRAVVVLRYLDDLSVAEVARVLDLPEGTVKSQAARALSRLETVLTSSEGARA